MGNSVDSYAKFDPNKDTKKEYKKSADNLVAICNLGTYYYRRKDYPNMLKHYMMAIKKGDA